MSTGLLNQLGNYFSDVDTEQGPVTPEQVAGLLDQVRELPAAPAPPRKRPPIWVAAAAAVTVLLSLGGMAWLLRVLEPVDQVAATDHGQRIAFVVDGEIHLMSVDGSNRTVIYAADSAFRPSWSPDGRRVAFTQDGGDIYTVDTDGTSLQRLTQSGESDSNIEAAWSPDGQRIAYSAVGPEEIFVMNSDGSGVTQLTGNGGRHPSWSPDGSQIAFVCGDNGSAELCIMNSDGSNVLQLTATPDNHVWEPDWSHNDQLIAFTLCAGGPYSAPCGGSGIYTIKPDGSDMTLIRDDPEVDERSPKWSPDGEHIVYVANGSSGGIFFMRADGTDPTYFVDGRWPSWSPR